MSDYRTVKDALDLVDPQERLVSARAALDRMYEEWEQMRALSSEDATRPTGGET